MRSIVLAGMEEMTGSTDFGACAARREQSGIGVRWRGRVDRENRRGRLDRKKCARWLVAGVTVESWEEMGRVPRKCGTI